MSEQKMDYYDIMPSKRHGRTPGFFGGMWDGLKSTFSVFGLYLIVAAIIWLISHFV